MGILADVLIKDLVLPALAASEKREVLDEMCTAISKQVEGVSRDELLEVLLAREQLGSTGIGYGVALPHGKLKNLDRIVVALGRSEKGVDFQSMDSRPVHLFFLIAAPENSVVSHLKLLAAVSRLLKEKVFRKKLLAAESGDELYRIIVEEEERSKGQPAGHHGVGP